MKQWDQIYKQYGRFIINPQEGIGGDCRDIQRT